MIGEQLRRSFSTAPPLAKTESLSILPYQFEPDSDPEYIKQEDRAEPARTDIARHIKVVTLLL